MIAAIAGPAAAPPGAPVIICAVFTTAKFGHSKIAVEASAMISAAATTMARLAGESTVNKRAERRGDDHA